MKKILLLLTVALVCMTANAELSVISPENNDYIKEWGRLKVDGTHIVSESGQLIQLKGWSSYGWQDDSGDCHSEEAIKQMKAWGANIYRGAMPVEDGGYNSDPDKFTDITKDLIDLTAKYGMYYLCTWYADGNPLDEKFNKYNNYFKEITQYVKSKEYKHVLYEIFNEPGTFTYTQANATFTTSIRWDSIKAYANKVLPIIQANDPGAIVVVPTPEWDQRVNEAIENPITGYDNLGIMYSFHYAACSHVQLLSFLERAETKIPVFISQVSFSDFEDSFTREDPIDRTCQDGFRYLMNEAFTHKIPWCYWAFGAKKLQSATLTSCSTMELTRTGEYVISNYMGGCISGCASPTQTKNVESDGVVIYPTPASDIVYVKADVDEIEVLNLAGCIVAKSTTSSVNIAHLERGTYIAKIALTNGLLVTKKIIKK
ncbi:MAG: cellulase family glycosylhydrolase [Paludibacteraceae bacterium]|nr:cellulase family glycosylhydrolase [Paludibacteraceae bacterium]